MRTPEWAPDFGPATPHPTAGATVIGARMPLIAYNINLATDRLEVAKRIAAAVRFSSGGLRYVKAMGVMLGDRGVAQVSMNLTNFEKTPIPTVFEMVKREAERYGVAVLESEIVGLIPQAALLAAAEYYLRVEGFTLSQVLENRLRDSGELDAALRQRFFLGALPRRDAERPHLAIQVAALDAQHLRGARHVAVLLRQGAKNVVALEPIAGLVQWQHGLDVGRRRLAGVGWIASQKRQIGRADPIARHHDHQPLDEIAQFAHVARPRVALEEMPARLPRRPWDDGRTRGRSRP